MSGDVQELRCLRTKQARFISTDRAFLFKMADGKKSFLLYADQRGIFEKLPDEEAGKLIKHIFAYVNDENPEGEFIIELAFESIKNQLKRDLQKWENQQEQRREAGRRSAESRKRAKEALNEQEREPTTVNERSISSTVNVNDNVNVNDTVNVNVSVIESLENRKRIFTQSVLNDYDKKFPLHDLKEFCEYWTEHGPNDKKMRYEKEKSFGVSRRISTWMKRRKNFKPQNTETFQERIEDRIDVMQQARALVRFDEHGNMID